MAFIAKHRKRLVREADKATVEAYKRYTSLVQELEEARTELVESRAAALWAALFPGSLANNMPNANDLATGLRKPIEAALGLKTRVSAAGVFQALRADADVLVEAMTRDQALELGVANPHEGGAIWASTPEGQKQLEIERREALERYRQMWGHYPS